MANKKNDLPIGAPTKRTPELVDAIVDAVARGVPEGIAAQAAGIDRYTLTRWKKNDVALCGRIKTARAKSVEIRIEGIRKAAEGGIQYETKVTEKLDRNGNVIARVVE